MRRLLSCLFKIEKEIAAINQKTILDSVLMPFSNCSGIVKLIKKQAKRKRSRAFLLRKEKHAAVKHI